MEHHQSSTVRTATVHHTSKKSLSEYWPFVIIYVLAALISLYTTELHSNPDYMSHVMGFVLIFFGLIKMGNIVGFAEGFAKYDPLAKQSDIYAQSYPFLEISLGILFILQLLILPATLIALFMYSASLYGALQSLMKKESLHCVCLGTYFKLPLSTITIIEASFMILMCVWMLVMFNSMTNMVM
jgi:hypothetical protein